VKSAAATQIDPLGQNGADKKIRTSDPIITNDVLYQLSYIG
jgi:hypothetical protein